MAKVFISYAHEDWPVVCETIQALENEGIICHYDKKDYSIGSNIDSKFEEITPYCDYMILFISEHSCNSKEVKNEYGDAISWRRSDTFVLKDLIGIRLDNYQFAPIFPRMERKMYADFRSEKDFQDEVKRVILAIKAGKDTEIEEVTQLSYFTDSVGFKLKTKVSYLYPPIIDRHPGIAEITLRIPASKGSEEEVDIPFILNLARPQDSAGFKACLPWWLAMFEAEEFRDKSKNPYTKERDEFGAICGKAWESTAMFADIGPDFPPKKGSTIISASFARDFAVNSRGDKITNNQFKARMKAILDADQGQGKIKACDAMLGIAEDRFIEFSNQEIVPIINDVNKYISAINFMMQHLQQSIQAYLWFYFKMQPNPYRLYPIDPKYFAIYHKIHLSQFPLSLKEWFEKKGIPL